MGKVIISTVCYFNEDEVIDFANNISEQTFKNVIFLVCCNAISGEGRLEKELKNIGIESYIYYPKNNLGYLNGCLYGVKKFGSINEDDTVIISNTDIYISDVHTFEKIVNKRYGHNVACVAPKVILDNGKNQNPFLLERPSVYDILKWRYIQSSCIGMFIYTMMYRLKSKFKIEKEYGRREIYSACGSFMIFSAQMINILNSESNDIFMYGEEIYISEIIRKYGFKIIYDNDYIIRHHENSTTKLSGYKRKADWYKQSYIYLYNEFFR